MGYGRIIQVSGRPIHEDNFINESAFYEQSFIGEVADWISEDTNRDSDISDFLDGLKQSSVPFTYEPEEKSIIFNEGAKKAYFSLKFETFKTLTEKCNIEDFSDSGFTYQLRKLIQDKFGYYVYDKSAGYPESFDEFMRSITEGDKYYFGATISYHY